MVVEPLYAAVALVTMGGTGRSVDETGLAEFDFESVRLDSH